ncbi:MAG: alpha/beta fold hydrolase [Alphaproteobacteria bacterium]|nr:alpha/beta fold hydrolase [Alphaproteobacteria bacterium]
MDESPFTAAIPPSPESNLGFASWVREITEAARATLTRPDYPDDLPRGNGETVLLIPGFLAGDWTMHPLRDFLRHHNYRVEFSGIAFNLGPTAGLMPHLEQAVERLFGEAGQPLIVIGQSLGGAFARALAHRHPEKIAQVITLGSPIRFPVTTPLEAIVRWLSPFHAPDLAALVEEIGRTPEVPVTALYSREDGIIDWQSCLQDETAHCVNLEVSGAHSAMGFNPEAQALIVREIARVAVAKKKKDGP